MPSATRCRWPKPWNTLRSVRCPSRHQAVQHSDHARWPSETGRHGAGSAAQVESSTDDLTASGVTLGTFDYISPEQARDPRNTDVRSDLYSLGCTLYFMLTGQPPFPDGTVLQKLLSHSSDEPPDLRQYRPDVDEEVARIVHKLLAKQPDQRFQSPRDLIGELLLVADHLDIPGIRTMSDVWFAPSDQKPSWWSRHIPWIAPVTVLLAVVLVQKWLDSSDSPSVLPPPRLAASTDVPRGDGTKPADVGNEAQDSDVSAPTEKKPAPPEPPRKVDTGAAGDDASAKEAAVKKRRDNNQAAAGSTCRRIRHPRRGSETRSGPGQEVGSTRDEVLRSGC